MNDSKFSPEDPQLTAYALGELEGEERAAIEAALKTNPAAQAAVAEIRVLAGQLAGALENEPIAIRQPVASKTASAPYASGRKVVRFPYYIVGTLAAACFAVMVVIKQKPHENEVEKVQLAAVAEAETAKKRAAETKAREEAERTVVTVNLDNSLSDQPPALAQSTLAEPTPRQSPEKIEAAVAATWVAESPAPVPVAGSVSTIGTTVENLQPAMAAAVPVAKSADSTTFASAESNLTLAAATPSSPGKNSGATAAGDYGEVVVMSEFSVTGVKTGTAMAMNMQRQSLNTKNVIAADSYGTEGESSSTSKSSSQEERTSRYARTNEPTALGPRMSFRAKSIVPKFNTETYAHQADNVFLPVRGNPLSTFSVDVDTASYSNVRRFLKDDERPPHDAVRIEEMVNYFPYRYTPPADDVPFSAALEVAAAPWNSAHRLVRIGLKGREISNEARPPANLVFLLDVSGSMNEPNKLPLVKESLGMMLEKLKPTDRVAIVTYAGASGLALPSTAASHKKEILEAIDSLTPGGSTNGAMGIQLAYDIAKANVIPDGVNRVILCTDGDFNIGMTDEGELTLLIEEKARTGVFLTVLGFGMGNLKDSTLEQLADTGNGNYGYIDSPNEAHKLLVEQMGGTLLTIAKDVKLQVEFNPAVAQSYRLIGYENRMLKKEDFNDDKVDAGEIGAGHTVTALYEVVPVGAPAPNNVPQVDPLKYQPAAPEPVSLDKNKGGKIRELLTVKIRYKAPNGDVSKKMEFPVVDTGNAFEAASSDFKFAAAVAGFGMVLRDSPHKGAATLDQVAEWAKEGQGEDTGGRRGEFIELVKKAKSMSAE